jgi:hypothetical protein
VEGVVGVEGLWRVDARHVAVGLPQRFGGDRRVQALESFAQALWEERLGEVVALGAGLARGDLGAVGDAVADPGEPRESGILNDRLG